MWNKTKSDYVGHVAILAGGKSVKILGGSGDKIYVKDLDGFTHECYHRELEYIYQA
tara:strand:- start:2347 stop:2514 length:168 start_codon:yes stop_codon:yes gene_type:complete